MGGNPYSEHYMLRVQRTLGWTAPQALMMFNPPLVLPLLAPLVLLPFRTAQICWLILSTELLFGCADLLWRYYGGAPDRRYLAGVSAVLFFPNSLAFRDGAVRPVQYFCGLATFLVCLG
jgi:hypothetical protein